MPKVASRALVWQPEQSAYAVRDVGEQRLYALHEEEEPQFGRLLASPSFSFQGRQGHLTLRKEARQHGEGYWYAYRSQGRKTLKRYVGRSNNLTIARLEEIAGLLSAEMSRIKQAEVIPMQTVGESMDGPMFRQAGNDAVASLTVGVPLLAPKLHLPRLHASLIARERLLSRMDAGLEGKLTLLAAPAGFGKTTLVSQWVTDRHARQRFSSAVSPLGVAWVSLDAGDNDPVRFWRYVITACQSFQPDLGHPALALLHAAQEPLFDQPPLEAALTLFLNETSQLAGRGVLVLEDYHVITSSSLHAQVIFLLDHLPANLHLVIITRVQPPFPLAALRAHGNLHELLAADLRFSLEETNAFLQQALPFPLSADALTALDRQMEGWVTGLHLLTLMLQGQTSQQDVERWLTTSFGNQRYLLTYFVSEILETQPLLLQIFLLQTSILAGLTAALCDAVTGRVDGEQSLAEIEQANLFMQPLDGSGQWYRYHPLFAEAMQHEARRRLGEEAVRECYGRASAWYEQHAMLPEAIEAALSARLYERALLLVERFISPQYIYVLHERHTLLRWLEATPEEILAQHPDLCFMFAVLRFSFGHHDNCQAPTSLASIEPPLLLAESYWQAENNYNKLGEVLALRAVLARMQGDLTQATLLAQQALAWLSAEQYQWRGSSMSALAEYLLQAGQLQAAYLKFQEARALFEAAGNPYGARAMLIMLGDVCFQQGAMHQAEELYREVLATAGEDLSDKEKALLGLARLSYEWNALDKAEQEARESLDLAQRLGDDPFQVHASLLLVNIQWAIGEEEPALQLLHKLLARASSQLQREILLCQARLSLVSNDLAALQHWSRLRAISGEPATKLMQEQETLMEARVLMAQGETDEALRSLSCWQTEAHQHGRTRSELVIQVLTALTYNACGKRSQAAALLRDALLLAHAEGYLRLFLDEGEQLATLLRALLPDLKQDLPPAYIRTLLRAFTPQLPAHDTASVVPASVFLIEQLSLQEQRVLRLLLAGYSNPEIAEMLIVSINTVKTQVQSIYRKLNVKSRKQAREMLRDHQSVSQ